MRTEYIERELILVLHLKYTLYEFMLFLVLHIPYQVYQFPWITLTKGLDDITMRYVPVNLSSNLLALSFLYAISLFRPEYSAILLS